jgi:Zn-dependent protease with chaperone function
MQETLVHPKEKAYFGYCLALSILVYVCLAISLIGLAYIAVFGLVFYLTNALMIGHLKGNAVRVSERQFPKLYRMAQEMCATLEISPVPDLYVQQQGGVLNAFATRFSSRNFIVLYSDILEVASQRGGAAVQFILGHELGHVKRRHVKKRLWLYPAMLMPFLGGAYSRACEYTADRHGRHLSPRGAADGLMILAAGKRLYRSADPEVFARQEGQEGFWVWLAEKTATHPNLTKRVKALEA